jgi:hypothetical protein
MKTDKFSQALTTQHNGRQRMQRSAEIDTNGTSVMEANQNTTNINRRIGHVVQLCFVD